MDYYLNEANLIHRLVKEWREYGQLIIAYDFDNTVFDFHADGHTYGEVIQLLQESKEFGAFLIVYTAREDNELGFVSHYLKSNDIPFDTINEGPPFLPFTGKKLYYNLLLDDRAGLPSAYRVLKEALYHMKNDIKNG